MNEIPAEILSHISSYLWLKDISSLSLTSRKIYYEIHSNTMFWIDFVESILYLTTFGSDVVHLRTNLIQKSQNYASSYEFVLYVKQVLLTIPTFWPRMIDTKIFTSYRGPEHIRIVEFEETFDRTYVLFTGPLEESVRSVVANDCFPYLPIETDVIQVPPLPFTKVVGTGTTTSPPHAAAVGSRLRSSMLTIGEITRSEIGYFECIIHSNFCPPDTNSWYSYEALSSRQSFSVGLACPPFALKGQFPGFDNFSLGYRSEDGALYQGGVGVQFGGQPYGAGDVVGCGIVYPTLDAHGKGKLFFTRNGQIQGRVLEMGSNLFCCIPWFPVVGIDSYYPISMNFGQEPFQFDVLGYEASLRESLNRPESYLNLTSSRLSLRVQKLHQENLSLSPSVSPQPLTPRGASSSPSPSTKINQTSRFSSNSLLHRSLRIIDSQTYKFQGDLLTDSESENDEC